MRRTPGGSPKARNLAAELRTSREASGVAQRELAQKLQIDRSRLQRWEKGTTVPTPVEVGSFLALCGVDERERARIVAIAENVDGEDWIASDVVGVRAELTTLIEFERTCESIADVSPLLIPGLLQTAGYVRALMMALGADDVDRRVGVRLGRQEVITKRNGRPYSAIIGEWALREPVGGCDVMAEQLRRLADLAERPNVEIRVLRANSTTPHPALLGAFQTFMFGKADPIVHLEHQGSAAFCYLAKEIAAYRRAEETLRDAAMNVEDSKAFIADLATAMEKEESE